MTTWVRINSDNGNIIEFSNYDITSNHNDGEVVVLPDVLESMRDNTLIKYDLENSVFIHVNSDALNACKKLAYNVVKGVRYLHETGGIVDNTDYIATTRDAQIAVIGSFLYAQANSAATISFKDYDGWRDYDLSEIQTRKNLVLEHVQECFNREKVLHTNINSATTISGIADQITASASGWPSNSFHGTTVAANTTTDLSQFPNMDYVPG